MPPDGLDREAYRRRWQFQVRVPSLSAATARVQASSSIWIASRGGCGNVRAKPQRAAPIRSQRLETDWLSTIPDHPAPQLRQLPVALHDSHDVVAAERPGLAGEHGLAVGDQDLGLADPQGMEQDLTGCRALCVILGADADIEAA